MTASKSAPPNGEKVKTGRRPNPAIDGPRANTVCFMLSTGEKFSLDRLAFCMNLTRSGLLANVVAEFVEAAEGGKSGRDAARKLEAYLIECRNAVTKRGDMATKALRELGGSENERNH